VGRAYRPGVVRVGDLPVAERASCESERSRGGPCMRRGAVEAFPSGVPRTSRSCPVELVSYETDPVRGRGALSLLWLIVSFFFIVGCGYPYSAGTDTNIVIFLTFISLPSLSINPHYFSNEH
jgi:hypothetical protein